jgi:predicted AlkP superfamily pyrophosphatase or phosphodiesterase
MGGQTRPVFPYKLSELRKTNGNYGMISSLPFGNDLLTELVKAALPGENLGTDNITDFLCISFSATDGVGHAFGPNAIEIEDTYIRLDKNIEDLLQTLDKIVGRNQYLLFLTGDHALAEVPRQMVDMKIPAGLFSMSKLEKDMNEYLNLYFPGVKLIEKISNGQIFFDHGLFRGDPKVSGVDLLIATQLVVQFLNSVDGIKEVYSKNDLRDSYSQTGTLGMIARGYHSKRSGDIAFTLNSGWISGSSTGSTHGSPYTYDTHVPMLFFGAGVKPGYSDQYHPITDIAPTLSVLLKIKFPSAATGQPITEITHK